MSIILIGVLMPLAQKIYELDSKLELKTNSDKESKYIFWELCLKEFAKSYGKFIWFSNRNSDRSSWRIAEEFCGHLHLSKNTYF